MVSSTVAGWAPSSVMKSDLRNGEAGCRGRDMACLGRRRSAELSCGTFMAAVSPLCWATHW